MLTATLLVTCHALRLGNNEISSVVGLPGRVVQEVQSHVLGLVRPPGRDRRPWLPGLPDFLNTELHKILVHLKHRLCRLERVLVFKGKISKAGEKIYASNGKQVDFAAALGSCEEAGGTLATPRNEAENKAILDIVKQYKKYAYLGIKEGETSGRFKYINGTPLNYTKWYRYEPNGRGSEKCVEMYLDGSWNDKRCHMHRLTVCEF
ncbi:PREDICTED: pulmonary surfactant-associated protein A-like [Chaetura pelagica]|uniref:pulmonary surfactant-associated protein A-like n=1 Tax=Chaetura pelagica TaxID=8897 RepID=UPI000523EAD3|nr:PREDICTED: pulmonary surfactant-associated protein A-like [Chaetura pelagica]